MDDHRMRSRLAQHLAAHLMALVRLILAQAIQTIAVLLLRSLSATVLNGSILAGSSWERIIEWGSRFLSKDAEWIDVSPSRGLHLSVRRQQLWLNRRALIAHFHAQVREGCASQGTVCFHSSLSLCSASLCTAA